MNTMTTKKYTFTSKRGNYVEVFNTSVVRSNGTFNGRGETVRTFCKVCGVEVECETGCPFTGPSYVEKSGY